MPKKPDLSERTADRDMKSREVWMVSDVGSVGASRDWKYSAAKKQGVAANFLGLGPLSKSQSAYGISRLEPVPNKK